MEHAEQSADPNWQSQLIRKWGTAFAVPRFFRIRMFAKRKRQRHNRISLVRSGVKMKIVLKMIGWPIVLCLTVLIKVVSIVLCGSAMVLGIVSMGFGVLSVMAFIRNSVQSGCMLLVLAYLISPFGLPMIAAWIIGKMESLRVLIRDGL